MDLGITGKTALVLGAGGGRGAAIARSFAREGVHVALANRSAEAVERTASEIRQDGGTAMTLTWDLADLSVIDNRVGEIEDKFGSVDILINNTGGPPPHPVGRAGTRCLGKKLPIDGALGHSPHRPRPARNA